MRYAFASVLPVALCALLAGCLTTEDAHEGDELGRVVVDETVTDPAALDTCDPESGTSEICCIEGSMTCPTTGANWDYVCANRVWAAGQCASHCAVACKRYEVNVCNGGN